MHDSSTASPAVLPSAARALRRASRRRLRRYVAIAIVALLAVAWFAFLRPPLLGGATHYVTVSGTSMLPTLHENDIVVLDKQSGYANGDIIVYFVRDDPTLHGLRVIHRIIGGSAAEGYITQGDNRPVADPWRPTPADIMGRQTLRIAKAGVVLKALKTPTAVGLLAMLWLVVLLWRPRTRAANVVLPEVPDETASPGRDPSPNPRPESRVAPGTASRVAPGTASRVAPGTAFPLLIVERRPIRTRSQFEKLTFRQRTHRYDAVAVAIRRRYLLEDDGAAKRSMRAMTFDLAATFASQDDRFDRAAFLEACHTLADDIGPR